MRIQLLAALFVFSALPGLSQIDTVSLKTEQSAITPDNDTVDDGIYNYDKYCAIMGGDSTLISRGMKYTGLYKDYYPDGKIKHKGYYDLGKVTTVFTNYYENGQIERVFKAKGMNSGLLLCYYQDGALKSRVAYTAGESTKWEDFYRNGKTEFCEEFSGNMEYYLYMRFYYPDGKPQILFELTDKKTRTYSHKEFWPSGKVKEEGIKVQNRSMNDYMQEGTWYYYSEDGKLILEEEYSKGKLISDKSY
ncbi:MAG: hypothetical protein WCM76_00325 [Bacteroidota bacterium]